MNTTGENHIKFVSTASRGERLYPRRSDRLHWHLTSLRREVERVIEQYITEGKRGTLIDYGCGNMPYAPLFQPHVDRYVGCDFPGNTLAEHILGEDGTIPLNEGSANIVLSTQVLEHVESPERYLGEANRVLSSDGLLILSTHGVWRYHPDPCDYWRWTSDGLRLQLSRAGFSVLTLRGVMGPAATAIQIWQDAVTPGIHWRLRGGATYLLQRFMQMADEWTSEDARSKDACVFVVVARNAK